MCSMCGWANWVCLAYKGWECSKLDMWSLPRWASWVRQLAMGIYTYMPYVHYLDRCHVQK